MTAMSDIITVVNAEVGNTKDRGNATATGDSLTVDYLIAPPFRHVHNDADFGFWIDGVSSSDGLMDYTNGIYHLNSAQDGKALRWEFNYSYWSDEDVFNAVNAGVGMLFPFFYNVTEEEVAVDGDTSIVQFTTEGVEDIRSVFTTSDGVTYSRMAKRRYELYDYGEDPAALRFYSAPSSGTVKARFITRPALFDSEDATAEFPNRAIPAVVSYACYHLLSSKQAPRIRSDVALATVGGGNLSPRQMNDASNSFYLRYKLQCEQSRQRPWRTD